MLQAGKRADRRSKDDGRWLFTLSTAPRIEEKTEGTPLQARGYAMSTGASGECSTRNAGIPWQHGTKRLRAFLTPARRRTSVPSRTRREWISRRE